MEELYNKFISNQNKGMVWKLLCDDGIFNNIPESKAAQVKDVFDKKIETIAKQINMMDNLVNLDKRIIAEMINDIGNYKKQMIEMSYNSAEIAQNRQKVFEAELKNKKKEFDILNSTPAPEKIDFSDNLDAPMGSEMDKILAEQIALRENQLNMVFKTQDKEAASKWIQNPSEVKNTNEPVKLKIGENIDMKEPARVKKVGFAETLDNDNFLALLKKKEPTLVTANPTLVEANPTLVTANPTLVTANPTLVTANPTIDMLREILDKQNQILEIIKTKN
jgi:hypothetical protein